MGCSAGNPAPNLRALLLNLVVYHGAAPAPMKTVLMGGSNVTMSRTSEDDVPRWESSASCEVK